MGTLHFLYFSIIAIIVPYSPFTLYFAPFNICSVCYLQRWCFNACPPAPAVNSSPLFAAVPHNPPCQRNNVARCSCHKNTNNELQYFSIKARLCRRTVLKNNGAWCSGEETKCRSMLSCWQLGNWRQIESAAKPELDELNDLSVQSGDTITSERQQECGQCDGQEHVEEQAEHEGKGGDDTNKGQRHRGCGDQLLPSSDVIPPPQV